MKAVVAAFNQEKALIGAFSVITNLRMAFVSSSNLDSVKLHIVDIYTDIVKLDIDFL